jgi:ATP-binding cassette subfamily B protein
VNAWAEEPLHAPYDPRIARRLIAYLGPYRRYVALAVGLLFATAAIEAAQPYLVKVAIDEHIARGDLPGLFGIALVFLSLLALEVVIAAARTYLTSWIGQRAMNDLRQRLFAKLQEIPIPWFDRTPIGRIVTRVTTDVEVLNELFSSGVVAVLSDALMLVAIAVTMLILDWRLALVTFAVLPAVLAASLLFRGPMRDAYREIRRWVARMNAYLQERVTGLTVVQLFRREADTAGEYGALNRGHRDAQVRSIFYYALFYPIVELLGALSVALILWYGGGQILQSALTFGALVAFLQYAQKFFHPIRDLAEKYNLLQAAMASGERLVALLDEPVEPQPTTRSLPAPRGDVVFEDVWFRYGPDSWVLKGVSFEAPAGTKLALVGATGAGKTTIASLLLRFYAPERGRILLDGLDVREYPREALRERVALVLQDVFLFSGSVRDNVRLHDPRIDDARVESALAAIGAREFVTALPEGLDTPVGERGRVLSTGQKQLVSLARALAYDSPVLVLDEATSSVDSETEAAIERATMRLLAGRTSIVIAHRLSTIRRVDRILVLHHGEVRESGTHAELLALNGLYARLYRLQFAGQGEYTRTREMA